MNHRSDSGKIFFKIPSEIRQIREASSRILQWLEPRKLDDSTLFDIRLCVEEVVRNAITHGNNSNNSLEVAVSYWVEGEDLIIEVEDTGVGFDLGKLPDPTVDENMMKGGGRGVYIVRNLMDKMELNAKGNKVRLTKHIK